MTASTEGGAGTVRTAGPRADGPPGSRGPSWWVTAVVAGCALVAALARVPGLHWSPGPDESGFTLVARTWQPAPDSPYGHYWVDRPPPLIALVRLTDAVGGVYGIRWVAVVGSALVVLAAAGVAGEVARWGSADAGDAAGAATASARAVVLTAVGTTAVLSNAMIDLVFAKGEVLSLPFLVGSIWLLLRAVRTRGALGAAVAGVLAGCAVGLKQNLVDGIVVAVVLLVGEAVRRSLSRRGLGRLGGAFVAGALVPLAATVAWALAAGVRLSALWYAVYGFRGDALDVILAGPTRAPLRRAEHLVEVAVVTGLVLLFLVFLLSFGRLLRERPSVAVATLVVLVVDGVSLALGGSYWSPYLFELVPPAVLALALLASGPPVAVPVAVPATDERERGTASEAVPPAPPPADHRAALTGLVVTVLVASCAVTGARWVQSWPSAGRPSTGVVVGEAIREASRPGDTLTVYGGQANVQLASGLPSPYAHLWSLPARTRDPGSRQLAAVLDGPAAPTWFLEWAGLDAWHDGTAAGVGPVLRQRYVEVAAPCGGHALYRLRDEPRPAPRVACADLPR